MTDPLSPPDDSGADDWSFDDGCWCGCDWEDNDEEIASE